MLLSRVADGLYWISRYLERAEHSSRVIDIRLDLGLDRIGNADGWDFERLYAGLRLSSPAESPRSPAALVDTLIFDLANPESVASSVTAARENARQVREEISSDMWEQLNSLYLRLRQAQADGVWSARPHYVLRMVIEGVHLFQGITDATMGHGEGWQYLQVGRFLERASSTAALLDLYFRDHTETGGAALGHKNHREWVGLLRSCCALDAYCRCYTADLRRERIAEFLLLNPESPRSVRFASAQVESSIRSIAQLTGRSAGERAERIAGRLHATLDYGQVDEILSDDPHHYVDGIVRYCSQIHQALYQTYMAYPIEAALPS
jgi:uncharacterized alpha-E superfamily protein